MFGFLTWGGWRNGREGCWDEGRKEGDQWVWIELTNMLHTFDLLYLYHPNDMTVLMLGLCYPSFFFARMPFFVYSVCVLMMFCMISVGDTHHPRLKAKKKKDLGCPSAGWRLNVLIPWDFSDLLFFCFQIKSIGAKPHVRPYNYED